MSEMTNFLKKFSEIENLPKYKSAKKFTQKKHQNLLLPNGLLYRPKEVVPVLVLLFVALWFILWGDLL